MKNTASFISSLVLISGLAASASAQTTISVLRIEANDNEKAINARAVANYEARHPDVNVRFEYLANEAYKQKLPVLLQSRSSPDIFYSWGGGTLREQFEAGMLRDITAEVSEQWAADYAESGVEAFTVEGRIVGAPQKVSNVAFWVNTALAEQAGIDIGAINTWNDFLGAVRLAKDAGITPIVVGGQDKWPLHFFYGYLVLRTAGQAGLSAAMNGEGEGFAAPPFVAAGEAFRELAALDPFQPGFMTTTAEQSYGRFGDKEAMFLLMGDWLYSAQQSTALDGQGIADEHLAVMPFPSLSQGAGDPSSTLGGIDGWAVSRNASDEAIDFLKFLNGPEYQAMAAREGIYIPMAHEAVDALDNPFARQMAEALQQSDYHMLFLDQLLGVNVGAAFNDASADLAQGVISPREAAGMVQNAWSFR